MAFFLTFGSNKIKIRMCSKLNSGLMPDIVFNLQVDGTVSVFYLLSVVTQG